MRKRRIKKARIKFISLVPKGANRFPVILKEDGTFTLDLLTKFSEGELLGLVYAPEVRDAQGDIASAGVIKEMAHDFAQNGLGLDVRHDERALSKDEAFVAETFIVQKGDPRFEGFQDLDGNVIEAAGGWGVVIKILRADLKAGFESGEFNGLSMGGHAQVVAEKEEKGDDDMGVTKDDLAEANAPVIAAIEGLTKALTEQKVEKQADDKDEPADDKDEPADEAPVFKGDPTNAAALEKHALKVRAWKLRKDTDWSDPDSIAAYAAEIAKAKEDARRTETPEQKISRLEKENRDLRLHGRLGSNQSRGGDDVDLNKSDTREPTDEDWSKIGKEMAEMTGYAVTDEEKKRDRSLNFRKRYPLGGYVIRGISE